MEEKINPLLESLSSCKANGISIHLVVTSSGLNFLSRKVSRVIEIDSPSFLGGNGNRLGPMAYCVAGISSCFIATFATVAASQGVRLTRLNASVECGINFAKTFDVADEPITEGITFKINAESDNADKSELRRLLKMAEERCPAMYSMSHANQSRCDHKLSGTNNQV